MANRREFLQAAAAASAVPAAARGAMAEGLFGSGGALHAIVADTRFGPARAFADTMAAQGVQCRAIEADVTPLWQDELRGLWRREPAALAGLTEPPALFLLERLAWEHRLRVVFHAEHSPLAGGGYAHEVLRGRAALSAADLDAAGARWPEAVALALDRRHAAAAPAGPTPAGLARTVHEPGQMLASWIIAPVARA